MHSLTAVRPCAVIGRRLEVEGAHYALESRGVTEIKGKGHMETFFVESVYDPAVGRGINGAATDTGDNGDAAGGEGENGGVAEKTGAVPDSSICEVQ